MKPSGSVWWGPVAKVAALSLGVAAAARLPGAREFLTAEGFRHLTVQPGWWGCAALLALGTCLPMALMPRWPFAVLCGLAFGIERGVLLASLTGGLGAALQYGAARVCLSRRERAALESTSWFRAIQASRRPFLVIAAVRIFPLSNFAVTNLACGLLRVPFGCDLGASVVGMLPSTAVYVMVGGGALTGDARFLAWAVALTALVSLAAFFLKDIRPQGVRECR
jgi:uncharacterized membrane protein YdjX (TVP38/TMEM64 family)